MNHINEARYLGQAEPISSCIERDEMGLCIYTSGASQHLCGLLVIQGVAGTISNPWIPADDLGYCDLT